MSKLKLLLNTVKYLKPIQIKSQLVNRLKSKVNINRTLMTTVIDHNLSFQRFVSVCKGKYCGNNVFKFLNLEHHFNKKINWDFPNNGKLWTYNLEYFDFIHDDKFGEAEYINLIEDFYEFSLNNKRVLEPYPISLRSINIIKFFIKNSIENSYIFSNLKQELSFLHNNYEYHLLGNHLLENGFAMILAGAFFQDNDWYEKAKKLIHKELDEQILQDGSHFELSPMYHQIIYFRLLELIDWYSSYPKKDDAFYGYLISKAHKMRSFLENIAFSNGDIPLFNDSARNITFESIELFNYSDLLGVKIIDLIPLSDSGFRTYSLGSYEIKMDFGQIGANYQAGHGHSDSLSFVLNFKNKPFLIEQGTSTYNNSGRRKIERSTQAHNTVVVDKKNQSEVWGVFRVGNRANTKIINEQGNVFEGEHDGYSGINVIHKRKFEFKNQSLSVCDKILGSADCNSAYFHFPKELLIRLDENSVYVSQRADSVEIAVLHFAKYDEIEIENYSYAEEFNVLQKGKRVKIKFKKDLQSEIEFKY